MASFCVVGVRQRWMGLVGPGARTHRLDIAQAQLRPAVLRLEASEREALLQEVCFLRCDERVSPHVPHNETAAPPTLVISIVASSLALSTSDPPEPALPLRPSIPSRGGLALVPALALGLSSIDGPVATLPGPDTGEVDRVRARIGIGGVAGRGNIVEVADGSCLTGCSGVSLPGEDWRGAGVSALTSAAEGATEGSLGVIAASDISTSTDGEGPSFIALSCRASPNTKPGTEDPAACVTDMLAAPPALQPVLGARTGFVRSRAQAEAADSPPPRCREGRARGQSRHSCRSPALHHASFVGRVGCVSRTWPWARGRKASSGGPLVVELSESRT